MEAGASIIVRFQFSFVHFLVADSSQKKRTSIVVAGRLAVLGDFSQDEQDNRVGFRFLPLFRRFADEFVIEPHIGLAFLDPCLCRP